MLRRYLGVSLGRQGLRAVCLRKRGGRLEVTWAVRPCEGIEPTPDRPMLESLDGFVDAVRETILPLARSEDRLGLSLPDTCGRTVFVQLPAAPASAAEEVETLRWKLREVLACDPGEIRLAYHRSTAGADGVCRYAVNVVRNNVFAQLVEGFAQAGFQIDFAGFKTFNLWQQARMTDPLSGKHLLLVLDDACLSLLAADNDHPGAGRTVSLTGPGEPVGEIARTLADWKRRKVIDEATPLFLFSENGDQAEWSATLSKSLGRDTRPLFGEETMSWSATPSPTRQQRLELTAALAAARLLAGGKP